MKYYLIILIFLFHSCKKENPHYNISCDKPSNNISISKHLIVGKWTWVSELYRQQANGQYILKTPQTEGFTKELSASYSIIEYFKNGIFEQKYHYEFIMEKSITNYPDDTANVLVFKDFITGQRSNYVHYEICNDTLTLNFQVRSDLIGQEKWVKIN